MHNKKILTMLLAALMLTTSSVTAFAEGSDCSSREREYYKKYTDAAKIQCVSKDSKDSTKYSKPSVSESLKKLSYNTVKLTAKKEEPKAAVKQEVQSPDVNKLNKGSVSEALKKAMEKAQQNKYSQDDFKALKDQIKAEYETQKAIEKANKELLEKAIAKQKQVRGYVAKVAEGQLTYTAEQLSQIDVLSAKLQADVQTVINKSAAIKAAREATKASMCEKDYTAALAKLKQETAVRQERGPALTAVNEDLDAIIAILAQGLAVQPAAPAEVPGETVAQ